MALSETFLKQTRDAAKQAADAKVQKQAREAQERAQSGRDAAFVKQQAAPLFEALDELAALPRGKNGYKFDYRVDYSSATLEISGSYSDAAGKEKNYGYFYDRDDNYITDSSGRSELTSKFSITVKRDDTAAAPKKARFVGSAWDTKASSGGRSPSQTASSAQALIDTFLASWVGRNIPQAAVRLQEAKEQKPAPLPVVLTPAQKLKKFAMGAFG